MRELALHVLDVLQNAVEAGATHVTLEIDENWPADRLAVKVSDNGRGMDATTMARATDPFYTTRTTRHVGLGLPLFAAAAERAAGKLNITSQPGMGTTVEATFRLRHLDRQPLGNMADTLLAFILSEQAPDLAYAHRRWHTAEGDPAVFEFDTAEIRTVLGDLPLGHPLVREWIYRFLTEGENVAWQS